MRRYFILVLVLLLAAVALVALIESDPGYVLVSYGKTTAETSIWVGLLLLMVFNVLFYLTLRGTRKLWAGGGVVSGWLSNRKQSRSRRLTALGMISYAEGDWTRARRVLVRAAPQADSAMINYLMAAKAGARLQQSDNVDQDLMAAAGEGESDLAVALGRAELQLDARNYQAAVATLLEQQSKSTLPGAGLSLLCRAYQGLSSWAEIAQLLPKLSKQKLLPLQELEQLEEQVHKALLITAIEAASSDVLNQAWAACPERLRQQGELPRLYLRGLLSCDPGGDVEKLVQRSLKTHWDSDLVVLYGLIPGKNPGKQLKAAESWLRDHEADAGLLLTLGRLSLRNELWGQARGYFERSDGLCASAETCAELARLTLGLGEPETSAEWSRRGLQLAAAEIPELPQPTLDKPGAEL